MMITEEFGTRAGEETVELPPYSDASLYYIGKIRTPWTSRNECPKNARGSEAVCAVELDPRWCNALKDVETCTHLILLYWMDRAPRNVSVQAPRHYGTAHGTFALRSPARPNPIAMSVVRLLEIAGTKLSVVGLDCLDGTPLLDIKPYLPSVDSVPDAVCGWRQRKN